MEGTKDCYSLAEKTNTGTGITEESSLPYYFFRKKKAFFLMQQ
jgi:hypothetical protein